MYNEVCSVLPEPVKEQFGTYLRGQPKEQHQRIIVEAYHKYVKSRQEVSQQAASDSTSTGHKQQQASKGRPEKRKKTSTGAEEDSSAASKKSKGRKKGGTPASADDNVPIEDLQNITKMAGVNLAEEYSDDTVTMLDEDESDRDGMAASDIVLLNKQRLRNKLQRICYSHKLKGISDDALEMMSLGLEEKLYSLVEQTIQAAEYRRKYGTSEAPADIGKQKRVITNATTSISRHDRAGQSSLGHFSLRQEVEDERRNNGDFIMNNSGMQFGNGDSGGGSRIRGSNRGSTHLRFTPRDAVFVLEADQVFRKSRLLYSLYMRLENDTQI